MITVTQVNREFVYIIMCLYTFYLPLFEYVQYLPLLVLHHHSVYLARHVCHMNTGSGSMDNTGVTYLRVKSK